MNNMALRCNSDSIPPNISDTSTMINCNISSIDYKEIETKYDNALNEVKKWEASLHEKYSFGDETVIYGMLAYLQNKDNGFSAYNHEDIYQSLRSSDNNGVLYNEAKQGAELYKQLCTMGPIVWKRRGFKR